MLSFLVRCNGAVMSKQYRQHTYWPGPSGSPPSNKINRTMSFDEWQAHIAELEDINRHRINGSEWDYWSSGYSPEDAAEEMYDWKDPNDDPFHSLRGK